MDYRPYAIDLLTSITSLRAAEKNCADRLRELNGRMAAIKSSFKPSDPVKASGESAGEDRIITLAAEKADEEKRLRIVRRRIREFNTAWAVMTDDDKRVLSGCYIRRCKGAVERLAEEMGCDQRKAYKLRDEALIAFTRACCGMVIL